MALDSIGTVRRLHGAQECVQGDVAECRVKGALGWLVYSPDIAVVVLKEPTENVDCKYSETAL